MSIQDRHQFQSRLRRLLPLYGLPDDAAVFEVAELRDACDVLRGLLTGLADESILQEPTGIRALSAVSAARAEWRHHFVHHAAAVINVLDKAAEQLHSKLVAQGLSEEEIHHALLAIENQP